MERPALQRLLDDIGHGLIDVVVVYKVDRLTRSLADFAKMVEIFDAHGVSFVAVTAPISLFGKDFSGYLQQMRALVRHSL
jgi:DNA invertase Pin-like site-specific DNA recombinase